MAVTINADTLTGSAVVTADNSGVLALQAAGVTKLTVASSGVTLASALPIASGGTNTTTTPTAGAIPYGTGTAYAFSSVGTSGQVLTSAGSSAPIWTTLSGSLLRVTTFTSSGTWTKGSGTNYVRVRMVGGGGGGGGCSAFSGRFGGGGGAGGYCEEFLSTSGVSTATVTIGALGAGGAAGANAGSDGGTTSFGAFCSATGGAGGGAGDGNGQSGDTTGLGGVGSGGDINSRGGAGGPKGAQGSNTIATGMGGNSMFGGGSVISYGSTYAAKSDAYGGGGAGGWSPGTAMAGADGCAGILIVEEYA